MSLTELLTSIANAIRNKNGTTDLIPAQNFATEISNLPSGDELIKEYTITDSVTKQVEFNDISIEVGDVYYLIIKGNNTMAALSINNASYTGYGYYNDVQNGGSNTFKSGKKLGCNRGEGRVTLWRQAKYFNVAGLGTRYGTSSAFEISDTTTPVNQMTVYAQYNDTSDSFTNGTTIALYKAVNV